MCGRGRLHYFSTVWRADRIKATATIYAADP